MAARAHWRDALLDAQKELNADAPEGERSTAGKAQCSVCGKWHSATQVRPREELGLGPDIAGWIKLVCTGCAKVLGARAA